MTDLELLSSRVLSLEKRLRWMRRAAILLGLRESSLIARSATDLKQSNAQRLGKRGRSDYNQAL